MADTTYPWNAISESQTDADSPIDTTLMEAIRQDLEHLREWMGSSYAAAQDHDHDGLNSKSVVLADSVVTTAKLKVARGSFSAAIGGDFYVTLDRYSHMPSLYKQGSTYWVQILMQTQAHTTLATELCEALVRAQAGNSDTFYVYWDNHAS